MSILLGIGAAALMGTVGFTQGAGAVEFAAEASVSPQIQYLGDSVGTTFTVTVDNVGTTDSIGAVQVARPGKAWTITGCPSAPAGWSAQRSDTMCRYRSASGTADNILPGDSSSDFQVTATVAPGTRDLSGTWKVKVSRSSNFDKPNKLTAAASEPPGLGITAHSFQVLDAVVDPAAVAPGDPCPAPSKSAITGSTGHTIVICGRNRTTGTLTPTEAQSSLGGTFVASHGSFSSGAVSPTAGSVVLGSWDDVTITSTAGPNKTVISRIGAASNQTSPLTTLTGYEALNNPPNAVDDIASADEDDSAAPIGVLANDTDPDGDPLLVTAVDTTGTSGSVSIHSGGASVSYDPNGQFEDLAVGETATDTFTYTVSDPFGASDTATVTVTVTGVNDPPDAVDDETTVGEDSTGTAVNVLGNDTDPDSSDTLTVSSVDSTGTSGSVSITNAGADVTYDPNGMFEYLAVGETATDTFTYTASDGTGTDSATVTITITGDNDPPDAVNDSGTGFSTASDTPFTTGNVLTNDTDPDTSDALSVQSLSLGGTLGLVTDNGDGTFAYDPNGAFDDLPSGDTATDTFGYVVSDGNGGTDTAIVTITITGTNHAPDAVNDVKTVGEDNAGTIINVLANDTDVDGDTLTVTSVDTTGTSGSVSITNAGADLSYDPNGQFEHLDDGDTATDTFTYTASDGTDTDTAVVTVTITGVNDAPTAVDDEKTVGEDNTGTTINVLGNDTDPDDTLTVTAVTSPTSGTVTNNGTDVTYDPNEQFEHLAAGETDTDTFTYTVSDGTATDTATVTVTIVGANDPPDAVDDEKTVGKSDPGTVIAVLANDSDPDTSDTLTVSSVDTTGTTGSVSITNAGANVTYDPNGQFDHLGPADTATDIFTYTVSDGNGGTDVAVVTVTVTGANAPPVANDDADTVGEDSTGDIVDVLANDTDSDPLTVTAVTSPTNGGTVTNNSTDVTYDPNGQFESLDTGETAQDTFTYTVSDGTDTDTATVTITVTGVNDAPDAVDDAAGVGENNTGTTIDVRANDSDPDGETLTVSAVDTTGTTGTVTITNGGADVSYNPNGQFEGLDTGETAQDVFTYTVTDGTVTDVATVTVTVTGSNDPPNAADDAQDVSEDSPGDTVDVLANDTDPDGETLTVTAVTSPTNGGAVTNNGTNVTYDPNGQFEHLGTGQTATDTFTYTVTDGTVTDTATVTITITGVNDAPNAVADSFDAIGNTGLFVGTTRPATQAGKEITGSILTNDTDPDTAQASLVAEPVVNAPTTLGGTITIESDGNFTYHPDDGDVAVTDTFTYRVCDASPCNSSTVANATGTLSLPLTGQVWYVRNDATPFGDGTSDTPFDTLVEAETASGAGDTVFVFDGNDTSIGLDTGFQMEAGERLIGELAGLSLDPDGGGTLPVADLYPSTAGARPTLTATNEDVVALDDSNVVRALLLDPQGTGGGIAGAAGDTGGATIQDVRIIDTGAAGTQPGLELDTTAGTFDVSDLVVDGSAATGATSGSIGVRLNNAGTVNFASASTISVTSKGARGLVAAGTNLGAGSVFDDITVTGSDSGGVSLSGTTGTVSLGDGTGTDLSLTTTGGTGLHVNGASNVTVAAAGTDNVQSTAGPALDITGGGGTYAFDLVDSTNSPSFGVSLMNIGTGTVDIDDGTISGYTNWGLVHSGGSGNVDVGADINDGAGVNVSVTNRSGGSVIFTGAVADSGDASGGAWASTNSNTTIRFEGGVSLSTGNGDAFFVSNTGNIVVTDPNGPGVAPDNTVTTTSGRAVLITDSTIGADGVTFRSVSSNGATNGIRLINTGSSGRLIVTGNGGTCTPANTSGCSGGTIANSTGIDDSSLTPVGTGIMLRNTLNPSFTRMWIHDHTNYGIRGSGVAGFTLVDSVISGVNGTSALTAHKDGSVRFEELTGTVTMTNVAISGGYFTNLMVDNTAGVLNATLNNVDSGALNATGGDDAVQFEGIGTSDMNVTYQNSAITTASGDLFQYIGDGTGGGDLVLNANAFSNNEPSIATGGGGLALVAGAKGAATMSVTNNTMRDSLTNALTIIKSRDATAGTNNLVATISGNSIGLAGTANSGSIAGDGMEISSFGDGNATFTVTNNDIRQYNSSGMQFVAGSGVADTGQFNLNISGNTIGNPGNNGSITLLQGIRVDSGVNVADTFATCVKFGANSITGSSDAADKDFRLVASQSTTIRQPGYVGGNTDGNAFAAYAASLIGGGALGTAVANAPATFSGTGTTCP